MAGGLIVSIRMEGLKEAIRKANDRPGLIGPPMIKAQNKVKDVWLRRSKLRTPVRTGRLRASEKVKLSVAAPFPQTIEIGTNLEYAEFVHEGTRFMEARPFFVWGFEDAESDIQGFYDEAGEEIERRWRGN